MMGSSLVLWKCDEIEVDFDQDLVEDSQDIPIQYVNNEGVLVKAFADPRSLQIKSTSKLYPPNTILHPAFKIQNQWFCKNGEQTFAY